MHFVVLNVLEEYIEHHILTTRSSSVKVAWGIMFLKQHSNINNNDRVLYTPF